MKGKIAIVTGAAKGIGKAIALELASAGAKVYANGRTRESLSDLLGEAEVRSLEILPLPFDVSKEAEVVRAMGTVERIDYLVNNAAVCPYVRYEDLTEEHWDLMFGVNVKGTYFCTRHALEKITSPGGSIVNISSGAGKTGGAFVSMPYGTSKAAINNMTVTFAKLFAAKGIRVNAVSPGFVETRILDEMPIDRDRIRSDIPLGKIGKPGDIAPVVRFVLSKESSFMTGQVIEVNGGDVMY
ncbi:MAG: SDR family NAD(P)-dependent oxidoreductase [Eubacteriales bacterium]|nr:SDR family NAD(P)-dependent oxidoreductase [Eubacteriales bacterium]MDD3536765.1 SDR family NAD(P)-dependent oxidoreductase [Eubacteriales bacterium]HPF18869.1 SDR family oxidoreductase [Bacillota bacterium]